MREFNFGQIDNNYQQGNLEKKICNEVDLPGSAGKMVFLKECYYDVVRNVRLSKIGVGSKFLDYLKESESKRKELFESYKAFLACGSDVDEDFAVSKCIADISEKGKNANEISLLIGMSYSVFELLFNKLFNNYVIKVTLCDLSGIGILAEAFSRFFCSDKCEYLLVDGYCDTEVKKKIVELIDCGAIGADDVVFIKRYHEKKDAEYVNVVDGEGTTLLEDKLKEKGYPKNAIDGNNYEALAAKGKEMYAKLLCKPVENLGENILSFGGESDGENNILITKNNKKVEIRRNGKIGRLFNTVKENKGKAAGGLVVFATLEELLRRSFFGGEKTNEKEGDSKDLKKLVDQKDTDKYPNRKDKNSATT